MEFVSLHNHSDYSILSATSSVSDILNAAKNANQNAVAITDNNSLASAWIAYKEAKKIGIKYIVGLEISFTDDNSNKEDMLRSIILLAKNAVGYSNLLKINKEGFENGIVNAKKAIPVCDWKLLEKYNEGIILLTGGGTGILSHAISSYDSEKTESIALRLKDIFKENLGLEVQTSNMSRPNIYEHNAFNLNFLNRQIYNLGKKLNIPIVPTCNSHYINKEDHETHDIMLAIGSHQTKFSNFRKRYTSPDFYFKTGEEVYNFFARNYPEEDVKQFLQNTINFANSCEEPLWVDPKFSNPSGKELPNFPVKDEEDYAIFKSWLINQNDKIKSLDEDKSYLRYKCEIGIAKYFESKDFSDEKKKEYLERIAEELDVFEFHGICSYMLIVADYVNYAKEIGVPAGPGRGCLTGDTKVHTTNGFKQLKDIVENDFVYTHTGAAKKVLNTFQYDVDEDLLSLKIENSFGKINLTKDHKIFGSSDYKVDPTWIEAGNLKVGDYIYTKFPEVNNDDYQETFDLSKYCTSNKFTDNHIQITNSSNKNDGFSMREISRALNIHYHYVNAVKNNKCIHQKYINLVETYLNKNNVTLKDWQEKPTYYNVDRFITLDDEFLYVLGRFVGDGSFRSNIAEGIHFAFHKNETNDIARIRSYFENKCYSIYECLPVDKKSNAYGLKIGNAFLTNFFADIFPNYKSSSLTKHFPKFFRKLSKRQLEALLEGYYDSDGYLHNEKNHIKTISLQAVSETKEILNFLSQKSVVRNIPEHQTIDKKGVVRNNKHAYKIKFGLYDNAKFSNKKDYKNGYYARIYDISSLKEDKVYDIMVEDDHSYLTSSGVVHNSVGGSLVAYLLGIHKADPIEYDLIFARFHNKEKQSYADIDSDFATSGRYKIEEYITNKYGKDNVAHVSNMNTLTPKVYSRDLARSCELGGSRESAVEIGTQIADSIPAEYHSISSAQQNCPLFVEYTKQYPEILDHKKIAGKQRAWSTHAAGIVIGNRSLKGLVPLRHDKDNAIALELTKEDAEEVGLVKMDLLGLSTLDILAETRQLILKNKNIVVSEDIPFDDEKTYKLLSDGNTFGVFQLGTSGGTTELCKRIKPKSIADISIINSLARPAAKDIRSEFIATKDGKKPLNLMHERLQRSFGKTYGFGLYEESLLYLAQDIAGWSLHSADRLRKLTKEKGKNPEKALKWRAEFIADSVNNGVEEEIATKIWDEIILPFGGYGFNMSHSIMYSMISYETAWLKANYPLEFLLANLMHESRSANPDASKNIDKFKQELRSLGVNILPPDINKSDQTYSIVNGTELLTGFEALESVGEDSILDILSKRPFKSFFDFMVRCGPTVRINAIQSLAASGALDCFGLPRKTIYLYVFDYKTKLKSWLLKHNPETETFTYPFPKEKDWTMQEKFALEIKYMGESFSCKTSEGYKDLFKHQHKTINDIKQMRNKYPCDPFHFILRDFFEFKIKKEGSKLFGRSMAKCLAEDKNGQTIGLTIFPDDWDALQEVAKRKVKEFEVGIGIKANCTVNVYEDEMGLILNNVYDILPIPQPPTKQDLAHKKVALRVTKKSKTLDLSSIEDELINEGLVLDQE